MNNEEAKVLLHAYHFDAGDPDDPRMAEALEQTRRDPGLLAWFNQQRALDTAVCDKLQQVRVPTGLAEMILAGRKARIESRRNRHLMPLALAASIVFLISLAVPVAGRFKPPATEFAALRADMAQFLREFPRLDVATDRLPEVREWLSQQHPLVEARIPKGLERFPSIGCRTVEWQGRKLALVCFMVEGQVVHLFVMPRNTFPDAGNSAAPLLAKVGSQNTAGWVSRDNQYLLVTHADPALLQKLL